ncbi:MAG: hypothetical protein CMP76_07965 [Flavobacterium sp.]|uniref:hypothetical protein n=1 Tax=Flavobacterium sp. TaxID=239 RepID=UPI000C3937AF|nr:hypothetical protein [Flavobacterium sp.]MBF03216.1 hypothetical protein [Flavobacterium sp.]|tara:strand:- start:203 stop:712 length:510 start_codon:yes stop_codon:yes gene_type:complete
MNNLDLKPIPYTASKSLIRKLYNYISEKELINFFKSVIEKTNSNNSFSKRSILCKTLTHLEFAEFVKTYGKPKGYFITPEFEETLQQLSKESKELSTKQISFNIEMCITEIREGFIILAKNQTLSKLQLETEKQNVLQKVCFKFNLNTSYIERIMGFKNEENETTSKEI